jgi:peptidoglycan/LPS O-acetylase OafA/YrhL
LAVLAFHAGLTGFGGGFVGVDVFFVLSGFLITGILLRERERTGAVRLRAFYARRARRILPAALVVIVLTLFATVYFAAPLDVPGFAKDGAASALSVGNIRFAAQSLDYFGATASPSPFLHYWSLGVEEQFYLVWPLLLLAAAKLWRTKARFGIGLTLGVVVIASFAASLILTDISAPVAFYSLPTRAWQLGLGGLLAVLLERRVTGTGWALGQFRLGRTFDRALGLAAWVGLAAIIVGVMAIIDSSTPYPGWAALLPALGSAALIAGGAKAWAPKILLASPPMRFLGRISFSLYLVHWPILVLPAAGLAVGAQLPLAERLGLAGISIVVATLCWRFVEEPFRRGRRVVKLEWRALGFAGASVSAIVALALAVNLVATSALDAPGIASAADRSGSGAVVGNQNPGSGPAGGSDGAGATTGDGSGVGNGIDGAGPDGTPPPGFVVDPGTNPSADPGSNLASNPGSNPDASGNPDPSPADPTGTPTPSGATTPAPTTTPIQAIVPYPVPGRGPVSASLRPTISNAPHDWEVLNADGCESNQASSTPVTGCVYGDPHGSLTVALVGDSHAGQWFPALNIIAKANHWKLVPFIKFSCRFEDIRQYSTILKREYTECEAWLSRVVTRLQKLAPDLIVVSSTRSPVTINSGDDNPSVQGVAMARLLKQVPNSKIAIIVDTPQSVFDVPACLSSHRNDVTACATNRATAFGWRHLTMEKAAAKALGSRANVVDLSNWLCTAKVCPAVLGGMIAYRDYHHLTATFAASLAPALEAQLPEI